MTKKPAGRGAGKQTAEKYTTHHRSKIRVHDKIGRARRRKTGRKQKEEKRK